MICKHCGYDVPSGIDFCTNCGEPMPRPKDNSLKTEETKEKTTPQNISKKVFGRQYVPKAAFFAVHGGAVMSYFCTAPFLLIFIFSLIDGFTASGMLFLLALILLTVITVVMQIQKSTFCALILTFTTLVYSIYTFAVLHELTFIWFFAGVLGLYGTVRFNHLWRPYKKTKIPPKKLY